jgi:hypothetical protein
MGVGQKSWAKIVDTVFDAQFFSNFFFKLLLLKKKLVVLNIEIYVM